MQGGDLMENFSGLMAGEDESAKYPIGGDAAPGIGRFASNSGDPRGSRLSRELSENELTRIFTTDPGLAENWLEVARVVVAGLLCTSIMLAGALLLTLVVCGVGWSMRLL
jgi:hypothetical protein